MNDQPTLLWYDLETFGLSPRTSTIAEFACIRTDTELEEVDSQAFSCKPLPDMPVDPESVAIHRQSPLKLLENGLTEAEFSEKIAGEFHRPASCSVGYNSVRFDNEFIRHLLFRNFFSSYEHEWKDGASKWDLIDVIRLAALVKPGALQIPRNEEGGPSFKLNELAQANVAGELPQDSSAHRAAHDTKATLLLARRLKKAEPDFFRYCFDRRGKKEVERLLFATQSQCLLYVSGNLPSAHHSGTLLFPLARHPDPKHDREVFCFDLRFDPEVLLSLSPSEANRRRFTPFSELEEAGLEPLGLQKITINRVPLLYPVEQIDKAAQSELFTAIRLDRRQTREHYLKVKEKRDQLCQRLAALFEEENRAPPRPLDLLAPAMAEARLYGDFIPDADQAKAAKLRLRGPDLFDRDGLSFVDPRWREILPRYKARNFPDELNDIEKETWQQHCREQFEKQGPDLLQKTRDLIGEHAGNPEVSSALADTLHYYEERMAGTE